MTAEEFETYLAAHPELTPLEDQIRDAWQADVTEATARQVREKAKAEAEATRNQKLRQDFADKFLAFIGEQEPALYTAFSNLAEAVHTGAAGETEWTLTKQHNSVMFDIDPEGLGRIRICLDRSAPDTFTKLTYGVWCVVENDSGKPRYDGIVWTRGVPELLYRAAVSGARWEQIERAKAAQEAAEAEDRPHVDAAIAANERCIAALAAAGEAMELAAHAERTIEEERMLAWLRSDPAAANLVRTFIAIEEGRQSLTERLNAADEAAENAWSHFETRAAELRREADNARREADRQRQAARDAETEAEDARRKIKDAERRANSYHRNSAW